MAKLWRHVGLVAILSMVSVSFGNVMALTDSSAVVQESYTYTAAGKSDIYEAAGTTQRTASAVGNEYMFTSRRWEAKQSNYYFRARFQRPALQAFLNRDPMEYVDSYSLYGYATYTPFGQLDPSGFFSIEYVNFGPQTSAKPDGRERGSFEVYLGLSLYASEGERKKIRKYNGGYVLASRVTKKTMYSSIAKRRHDRLVRRGRATGEYSGSGGQGFGHYMSIVNLNSDGIKPGESYSGEKGTGGGEEMQDGRMALMYSSIFNEDIPYCSEGTITTTVIYSHYFGLPKGYTYGKNGVYKSASSGDGDEYSHHRNSLVIGPVPMLHGDKVGEKKVVTAELKWDWMKKGYENLTFSVTVSPSIQGGASRGGRRRAISNPDQGVLMRRVNENDSSGMDHWERPVKETE